MNAPHLLDLHGGFKVPKTVEFAEALPRTPNGKIQKSALREPYWRGEPRQVY